MNNRIQPLGGRPQQQPRQMAPAPVQQRGPQPQQQRQQAATQAQPQQQRNSQPRAQAPAPAYYENQPWQEIMPGIHGSVQNGTLCLKIALSDNPQPSNSGKADMLAATGGWKKLDNLLGEGHGLSVSVTRSRRRKQK